MQIIACPTVEVGALPEIHPPTAHPFITQEGAPPVSAQPMPIRPQRPIPRATPRREPTLFVPPAQNTRSHTQRCSIATAVMLSCINFGQVTMQLRKISQPTLSKRSAQRRSQ